MTKKTKPSIKLGFTESISIITAVFIFSLLIKNSSLASNEVIKALKMCGNMLIPSLFPLTVASEILTNSGAIEKITKKVGSPIAKILGVKKIAVAPYFLGLFGGYTSSCKSAVLLYQNGKISKNDCESIIALSNIPSLAFMTGFIGVGVFGSIVIGWKLWLIAVLSTLILGGINNLFFTKHTSSNIRTASYKRQPKNISKIVVEAIGHSAYAMLIICACVVFFSVLIAVLSLYLNKISLPIEIKNILLGSLEITKGVSSLISIENTHLRALICAFLVGWSGLCVHFQIIAISENTDISFKKYFIFKCMQGLLCVLLTMLFL